MTEQSIIDALEMYRYPLPSEVRISESEFMAVLYFADNDIEALRERAEDIVAILGECVDECMGMDHPRNVGVSAF